MPRNGTTGIATQPVNTRAVTGETIMAEKWNSVTDDIYSILSTATPLTQGGTGASTAAGARTALDVYSTTEVDDAITALDADFAAKADKTTTITAGDGLTGGGSLVSSRTISADIADSADIAAGTPNKLVDAEGLKAVTGALDDDPYISSEISIVTSSVTTLTHGLGVEPGIVQAYLICKTAELGYAVGSKVFLANKTGYVGANAQDGIQIVKENATTITITFGNYAPYIIPRGGGNPVFITAVKWRLVMEARK